MYDTANEALDRIQELALPYVMLRIWKGVGPRALKGQYEKPVRFFEIKAMLESTLPQIKNCLPLLECNRELLLGFDETNQQFVEYWYGDTDWNIIGSEFQQLVAAILVEFAYSGLDDVIHLIAADFEFKHLEALIAFLQSDDHLSADEGKRQFITSICG